MSEAEGTEALLEEVESTNQVCINVFTLCDIHIYIFLAPSLSLHEGDFRIINVVS